MIEIGPNLTAVLRDMVLYACIGEALGNKMSYLDLADPAVGRTWSMVEARP